MTRPRVRDESRRGAIKTLGMFVGALIGSRRPWSLFTLVDTGPMAQLNGPNSIDYDCFYAGERATLVHGRELVFRFRAQGEDDQWHRIEQYHRDGVVRAWIDGKRFDPRKGTLRVRFKSRLSPSWDLSSAERIKFDPTYGGG